MDKLRHLFVIVVLFLLTMFAVSVHGSERWVKGIYITQSTMENPAKVNYLIRRAKETGINTFVVDVTRYNSAYNRNIAKVKNNGIYYVARIVVFPDGGTSNQVLSQDYWQKKYRLVNLALQNGAKEIQLDYIRYKSSQPRSAQNVKDIYNVIRWFKSNLEPQQIPLQVDVFGVATLSRSLYIGQDVTVFADAVNALCPMLYPSHYEPYEKYAKMPYFTVKNFLRSMQLQFDGEIPVNVYAWIELSNYRYPMSQEQKLEYINEQIRAVEDTTYADGWYAWSPNNHYDNLFTVLETKNRR